MGPHLRNTQLRHYGAHVIASDLFQRWPDDDPVGAGGCRWEEVSWRVGKRRTEMLGRLTACMHIQARARDGWGWGGRVDYFQTPSSPVKLRCVVMNGQRIVCRCFRIRARRGAVNEAEMGYSPSPGVLLA